MKKFAVGYINFFHKDVVIDIVEAETWVEAVKNHKVWEGKGVDDEYLAEVLSKDIDDAKDAAFDGEWAFDVKEI